MALLFDAALAHHLANVVGRGVVCSSYLIDDKATAPGFRTQCRDREAELSGGILEGDGVVVGHSM